MAIHAQPVGAHHQGCVIAVVLAVTLRTALFFRKAAVEITFENKRYLVVPQAAILVLMRRETEET